MITLGCFLQHSKEVRPDELKAVAEAGYDNVQFMFEALVGMDEAQFKKTKELMADLGLTAVELVCPFPNDQAVFLPEFDLEAYKDTLKLEFERAAQLGTKLAEFAQRLSRMVPTDIGPGHQEYRAKLIDCMATAAEIALPYGIRLSIEPTSRISSNFMNSFGETVEVIREMNFPGMGFDADIHHMLANGEPYENMFRYKEYVVNVHLRAPYGVSPVADPPALDDGFDYDPFMNTLKAMEYDGPITIEGRTFANGFSRGIEDSMKFLAHYGYYPARNR